MKEKFNGFWSPVWEEGDFIKIKKSGEVDLSKLEKLQTKKDELQELKITFEWQDKRTLDQNKLMWRLLGIIAIETAGKVMKGKELTGASSIVYRAIIKEKCETLLFVCNNESDRALIKSMFSIIKGEIYKKNKWIIEAYKSSSHFDKEEMKWFIDLLFDMLDSMVDVSLDNKKDVAAWREKWTINKNI